MAIAFGAVNFMLTPFRLSVILLAALSASCAYHAPAMQRPSTAAQPVAAAKATPISPPVAAAATAPVAAPAVATATSESPAVASPSSGLRPDLRDGMIINGATRRRILHFTFDDGPDWRVTPRLLDALDEAGIKQPSFFAASRANTAATRKPSKSLARH